MGKGDLAGARELLDHARTIDEKLFGPKSVEISYNLIDRAILLIYEAAQMNEEKVISFLDVGSLKSSAPTAIVDVPILLAKREKEKSAEALIVDALTIRLKNREPGNPLIASAQHDFGTLLVAEADYPAALKCLNSSLKSQAMLWPEKLRDESGTPGMARTLIEIAPVRQMA